MPFRNPGRDIKVVTNEANGRLDFEFDSSGNFTFDDTRAHAVASVLWEHRGAWWADTNGTRGSRLHEVKEIRRATPSLLSAHAREALQRLIDKGEIVEEPVILVRTKGSSATIDVRYKAPDGTPREYRTAIGDT